MREDKWIRNRAVETQMYIHIEASAKHSLSTNARRNRGEETLALPNNFMAPFWPGGGNNALASPTFKKGAGGFSRYTLTREPRNGVEPTVGVLGVTRIT